jgi:hypothetical protein
MVSIIPLSLLLKTKLYNKCDDFTFSIVNFPFISSLLVYIPRTLSLEAYWQMLRKVLLEA